MYPNPEDMLQAVTESLPLNRTPDSANGATSYQPRAAPEDHMQMINHLLGAAATPPRKTSSR
jgi:hypothetical protein